MNTATKYIAIGISMLLVACSAQYNEQPQHEGEAEYAMKAISESATNKLKLKENNAAFKERNHYIHSTASQVNSDTSKKFIRKADMKFRVGEVEYATYEIENAVQKFDGYVSHTHLRTDITSSYNIQVAKDSTMEITYYNVVNIMTLRVPNANLDTTLKEIAGVIEFLDFRTIKANNVTLSLLSKQLERKRNADYQKRLKALNVQKDDTATNAQRVEREIFQRQVEKDHALIERLKLEDEIDFSTITLEIYQPLTYQLSYPAQSWIKGYEPGVFEILASKIKSGWDILMGLLLFIIEYWSVWFIFTGIFLLGRFIYRKLKQ